MQKLDYLKTLNLLSRLQSAYQAHPLTDTVVLRVLANIFCVVDNGDISLLMLLDLLKHNNIIT